MRYCPLFSVLLLIPLGFAGCPKHSPPPPRPLNVIEHTAPDVPAAPDPHQILDQMVTAYRIAVSYSDQATVQIIGKMTQPHLEPAPWNCAVAFQKPNQFRLDISEGNYVSDGEYCYAQIQSLSGQFLRHQAQKDWTLETLFQNVQIDHAMALRLPPSVLRFPPQLILLLANNPLNTFCPKGAKIEWLEQKNLGQDQCDVIRITHSDGNRIFWISQENHALLRMDYQPVGLPIFEGFESIEAIRIELSQAQFNGVMPEDIFHFTPPPQAVRVSEFQSDVPGLPTAEEHRRRLDLMADSDSFRLIDQQIESVMPHEQAPPPKIAPTTFSLTPRWTHPLIGGSTIALLPAGSSGAEAALLIPCEGNLVAALDLQGKTLQKRTLENVNDTIIREIRVSPASSGQQRWGILTFDSKFFLFDTSFKPLEVPAALIPEGNTDVIRDFQFIADGEQELLVLGRQRDVAGENGNLEMKEQHQMILTAADSQGLGRGTWSLEGIPYQISAGLIADERCFLISYSFKQQDQILVRTVGGQEREPVEIPAGRHVLWFQVLDPALSSTIYTFLEDPATGDVRFAGLTRHGKGLWSRLLPAGEYEIEPVYVPKKERWLVPLPNGEIMVFDLQGNVVDTFALNVVPTGLFCAEIDGVTILIITDGTTVSAWTMQ